MKKQQEVQAAPVAVVVDQGVYEIIDINKVTSDKNNYRKAYDAKSMLELTASIATKGVLQPILVRPNGGDTFLIVAGHRRHKAAYDAGLKTIPAIIRNLTDADALELQVVENSQREDPNPMEEAWGFDRLIKLGKHSTETLAAKLDKSVDYILGRISLLKLPDEAQKKVAAGEISLGHALLLTRLRHPSEQKEFIKMLNRDGGLTVKEAQRQIREFSRDIKDAIFDIAGCKVCNFLGRNQSVLFPELKNSGECMDRGCFLAKERDHIKVFLDERKAEGFKTILKKDEFSKLVCGKAERIQGELNMKGHYYADTPKRYKTECVKCTDNHAFFMFEESDWRGKSINFGELCLNKNCLRKMKNPSSGSSEKSTDGGSGRVSASTVRIHAMGCRDRFLKANLPDKIHSSHTLQKRLLAYTLLIQYGHFQGREDLLKELGGKIKVTSWGNFMSDTEIYETVMKAKPETLGDLILRVLLASIDETNADVLLRMTPEAGIDMTKDFPPDKTFLQSKTKAELEGVIKKFKLDVELKATAKKGDIIEAILKHDLKGKLTKDLADVVTIKGKS